jgi:hypothetical protein
VSSEFITRGLLVIGAVVLGPLITWLLSLGKRLDDRIERELNEALGLMLPKASPADPQQPSDPAEAPGETGDAGAVRPVSEPRSTVSQNGDFVVTIHDGGGPLAEMARLQDDGHARLITKYYAQGYQQSYISFVLSMVFAVAGFAILTVGVAYGISDHQQVLPAGITSAVGLVNQAVGVLFFRRADKARDTMMQMIDRLRADREKEARLLAGLAAIEQIDSPSLQDALRASAALSFIDSNLTLDQLTAAAVATASVTENRVPRYVIRGPSMDVANPLPEQAAPRDAGHGVGESSAHGHCGCSWTLDHADDRVWCTSYAPSSRQRNESSGWVWRTRCDRSTNQDGRSSAHAAGIQWGGHARAAVKDDDCAPRCGAPQDPYAARP